MVCHAEILFIQSIIKFDSVKLCVIELFVINLGFWCSSPDQCCTK